MKEFFTQCMKDLESLTGLRQLYFIQSDLEDGLQKFDVLIDGMVSVAAKYDYIPDAEKKKIIRKMMIEDQAYESLNSRIIFRWLDQNKGVWFKSVSHRTEEPEPEPASPEVAQKYIDQLTESLKNIGNPAATKRPTHTERHGKSAAVAYVNTLPTFVIEGYAIRAVSEDDARRQYDMSKRTERKSKRKPQSK